MKLSRAAALAIVATKAGGDENSAEEIGAMVAAYCADELDEHIVIDWLRAIMAGGMSVSETASLTEAMAASGTRLEWAGLSAPLVDKHSTGGVGDDVSLIAVPVAAACGVKVAKLSGGALGHTGGTLDKLECIPGLRTALSFVEFKAQITGEVGCAIAQANAELAPADKKIYHLRHRTGTIASVPLITASVLSKKIAAGAPNLVIDVKSGSSAFMASVTQAQALATMLLEVGTRLGKSMEVLLTDMDAPLANSVGDGLELAEALDTLENNAGGRLCEVALTVAAAMIGIATGREDSDARAAAEAALRTGAARQRFAGMVRAQGGDLAAFARRFEVTAELSGPASGFVATIDGRRLGEFVNRRKHQHGDNRAGLQFLKRRGDR